jgi:alpha-L-fucosidase
MDQSYCYNRNESVYDYNTVDQLIDWLTKCAMNGGNLLLDIGPTADGRIPVIMQNRLLSIGKWLRVNGEAIYGTHRWDVTSENNVRYTVKEDTLYDICLKWPGEVLKLSKVKPASGSQISMLGFA